MLKTVGPGLLMMLKVAVAEQLFWDITVAL
jgi:hypothetical protein